MENKVGKIDLALIPDGWDLNIYMILIEEKIIVVDGSKINRIGVGKNALLNLEGFKSEGYKIIDISKYPHITNG